MSRKEKKYHYLYKTVNLLNGKYYYGIHSADTLDDGYLGSGKYLRNSIHRHGKKNFKREILKFFESRELLIKGEEEFITKEIVNESMCMNLCLGGKAGSTGMVSVKDSDENIFSVFKDDPRYLSGELISIQANKLMVNDVTGKIYNVFKDDPRYLSGELISTQANKLMGEDINKNVFQVSIDDPRFISGELKYMGTKKVSVKDKNGITYQVSVNDPRYLSGELKCIWYDKQHTDEAKAKMSAHAKEQTGSKNSQFGTCWITLNSKNKKIKKTELHNFIELGWIKGRKMK